jgi:hypothetical protein
MKLDINIQCYTFELEESQNLCIVITHLVLPTSLRCAPDSLQEVIENGMCGIDTADLYINDMGAFALSWEHHIKLFSTIFWYCQDNRFTISPLKCEWVVQEMIGLVLGSLSVASNPGKRKLKLSAHGPFSNFLLPLPFSCVNYSHDMWPACAPY